MSTFTVAISFDHFQLALIHGPDIPGSYAILLFTASNLASITSHIHNWVLVLLWLHPFIFLELFLHWSPVAYWAPTDLGAHLSVSYPFAFHTVHGVLKAKILKWFAIPFSSGPHFVTGPSWVALHSMAHSFIELDKAVVHVISLIHFLWLLFSFCPPCPFHSVHSMY